MTRNTFDRFTTPDRGRFGENECGNDSIRGNDSVRSDIVDVTVAIHYGTDRAILVSIDGNESRAQWLPKSKIEIEQQSKQVTGTTKRGQDVNLNTAVITLPQWLAKAKGLV